MRGTTAAAHLLTVGRGPIVRYGPMPGGRSENAAMPPYARMRAMPEVNPQTAQKVKPKLASGPTTSTFEAPRFDMPNFEVPKMEIPAAFREIAEKSVAQAKESYEKMKSVAEEATDVLEDTYATASKGAADYGLKVIEAARANTNAAFDFYTQLMTVKSLSEVVELSTAHARKQFEAVTAQSKELASIAQKVATETAEPIKDSVSKAFNKVA
jgi:phasin